MTDAAPPLDPPATPGVAATDTPSPIATQRKGDLTQGPLVPTLIAFALPQMVGNILQTLNGSINAVWVGRLLGEGALAATANANIVMFLLFALVFGFGMSATVRIGQAFGARDIDAARRTFGTAVGLAAAIAITVTLAGWIFAPQLLDALKTPGDSRGLALTYLRVVFLSTPAAMVTLTIAMGLRGVGDAKTPLLVMLVTALLDVGLNPLLIRGFGPVPALGIAGSALATAFATAVGLIAMVTLLYRRDLVLRLRGAEIAYLVPNVTELRFIFVKGIPMGGQMLVISGAGVILIDLVNREGLDTAAAYGALLQIWNYMAMPAMAIGAAVSAMTAQHIGAGRAARVDAITLAAAAANTAITGALTVLLLLFDGPALRLFLGSSHPAIAIARHAQTIAIWSYLPFGVTIVVFGALRAFGVVIAQLVVLFIAMYVLRLGAYHALYPRIGTDALWISLLVSSSASMAMVLGIYRFGRWRHFLREGYKAIHG